MSTKEKERKDTKRKINVFTISREQGATEDRHEKRNPNADINYE